MAGGAVAGQHAHMESLLEEERQARLEATSEATAKTVITATAELQVGHTPAYRHKCGGLLPFSVIVYPGTEL